MSCAAGSTARRDEAVALPPCCRHKLAVESGRHACRMGRMSFRDDGGPNGGPWGRMGRGPANPLDPFPQEPQRNRRYGLRLIIIFGLAALGCVFLFSAYPPSFTRDGDEVYVVQYGIIGAA